MEQARFLETFGIPLQDLANVTAQYFQSDGFETYVYSDPSGRIFVDAHKQGTVRSIFGLAAALNVAFTQTAPNQTLIEFGGALWGDKFVAGAIGFILFPPFLVTAAIGAWQQGSLADKVDANIRNYIYSRVGRMPASTYAVPYSPYGFQSNWGMVPPMPPVPVKPEVGYGYYNPGYAVPGQEPPPTVWPTSPTVTRQNWFDQATMQPVFSLSYNHMETWKSAIADGVIQSVELEAQEKLVADLQKQAEDLLEADKKIQLAEIMAEMDKLEQK